MLRLDGKGVPGRPFLPMVSVIEPATEAVLAELPQAGVEETDAAIASAREAFPAWRAIAPGERAALLRNVAARVSASSNSSRSR